MKIELDLPVPEGWRVVNYSYGSCNDPFKETITMNTTLTFERIEPVDEELEQAKKLIGTWVVFKTRNVILKVKTMRRDNWSKKIVFEAEYQTNEPVDFYLEDFNPFPLPTWRCCDDERPKKDGRYFIKDMDGKLVGVANYSVNDGWYDLPGIAKYYGWLDEGEL